MATGEARASKGTNGIEPTAVSPVLVVGTGLAGLAAALSLATLGVPVIVAGPRPGRAGGPLNDTRSTALFGPSVDLLEAVGAFTALRRVAVPLTGLRLIDDTGSLWRAPEVLFEASEIGLAAFGMNVENVELLQAMADRCDALPGLRWFETTATDFEIGHSHVRVGLADGRSVVAHLVVGADGVTSPSRRAAGIATEAWSYPQTAIATRFRHSRPHGGVSTELHRRAGPLTTVPLSGDWSSLVWVEAPAEAQRLMAADELAFAVDLEGRVGEVVGAVTAIGPRAAFPLSGVVAEPLAQRRIALVGEAGHRLPPIGAQGLNLGLRDAAWLADLVADALAGGRDPGGQDVLAAYDAARRRDVKSRALAVDVLNRSLLAGLLPVDVARGAGLATLKSLGPLRRLVMREGVAPSGTLPRLMQAPTGLALCGSPLA